MRKIHLVLGLVPLLLGGCAAERLKENTASVSASTTDVYYQMVLQNLARNYAQNNVLPWGVALTTGTVAVNDNAQLMGGYTETSQAITPSVTAQYQIVLQQQWATAPVSNPDALAAMYTYYGDVIAAFKGKGPLYLSVELVKDMKRVKPLDADGSVKEGFLKMGNSYYFVTPTPGPCKPIIKYAACSKDNFAISLKAFQFLKGVPPSNTLSATYHNMAAYVTKDPGCIHSLALFTMLVLGTIDQIPAPPTPGASAAPAAVIAPLNR